MQESVQNFPPSRIFKKSGGSEDVATLILTSGFGNITYKADPEHRPEPERKTGTHPRSKTAAAEGNIDSTKDRVRVAC